MSVGLYLFKTCLKQRQHNAQHDLPSDLKHLKQEGSKETVSECHGAR